MTSATGGFAPTAEQIAAVDAFKTGENMTLEALAGTGKTSTLRLLAGATGRRGLYLAFNKSVAVEAGRQFPSNVRCSTVHSIAYGAVMDSSRRRRMGKSRQTSLDVAKVLGITNELYVPGDLTLKSQQVARIVMDTVRRFCYSSDDGIDRSHVPWQIWSDDTTHPVLVDTVLPLALKAWGDLTSTRGRLKYGHDHYLKEWGLGHPVLPYEFVMVDEAQDTNPVVAQVVREQRNAQVVAVGDANQAIYQWRGAVDAMRSFNPVHISTLTKSFRFGDAIAVEANKWLNVIGSELQVQGFEAVMDRVGQAEQVDVVLCRTNAGAIENVMAALDRGLQPAIVGGGEQIKKFAQAAKALIAGKRTAHPDLCAFKTWDAVKGYVNGDSDGADLAMQVRLVDKYGADEVIAATDATVPEEDADLIVSTAHKAKGREWTRVRIHSDFPPPKKGKPLLPAEGMLAYVATTRAKRHLDPEGLSWIDAYMAGTLYPELAA